MRTETNHIVTLLDNVGAEVAGSRGWLGEPPMQTYHQEIVANLAVVGRAAWDDCEQVRRATFSVEGSENILQHIEKMKEAAKAQLGDGREHNLLSAKFEGGSLRIDYAPKYSFDLDRIVDVDVYFDVEFDAAIRVREGLVRLFYLARFFSLSTGVELRPTNVQVYPASRTEVIAAAHSDRPIADYAVYYPWWGDGAAKERVWPYRCAFITATDEELEATRDALVAWQSREAEWSNAVNFMVTSISLQNEISQHRLVTAARWLSLFRVLRGCRRLRTRT